MAAVRMARTSGKLLSVYANIRRAAANSLGDTADSPSAASILIALPKRMKRRRALNYALMAAVAAVMGLLLLRAPFGFGSLTADFFSDRYTFTYLFVAIAVTFLGLGYVLGRQADTLRRLSSTDPLTGLAAHSIIVCGRNGIAPRVMAHAGHCC
jgi:hypothetical protein